MTKNNLVKGLMALSVLALVSGTALSAQAATTDTSTSTRALRFKHSQTVQSGLASRTKTDRTQKKVLTAEETQKRTEMLAKRTAINTALTNSDYQAWLTAVGSTSDMAKKITADNFPKLAQAYNLRLQSETIMKDLGLGKMMFNGSAEINK